MAKSAEKLAQQANASVGYGPNNPEPIALKGSEKNKNNDSLHSAMEYINKQY